MYRYKMGKKKSEEEKKSSELTRQMQASSLSSSSSSSKTSCFDKPSSSVPSSKTSCLASASSSSSSSSGGAFGRSDKYSKQQQQKQSSSSDKYSVCGSSSRLSYDTSSWSAQRLANHRDFNKNTASSQQLSERERKSKEFIELYKSGKLAKAGPSMFERVKAYGPFALDSLAYDRQQIIDQQKKKKK
ncbi:uncharacterized protein DDB_G0271670-like [Melanaphis sacchari]|uniref:uncharacterized protein DDB_G0271670-like n=1 Tax=Melanaphis sacchari TaxID=742174 RepID=UPI000DC15281|nr:uncharacterized protein DDB_G0271670-like [Melanaphis sacchari]